MHRRPHLRLLLLSAVPAAVAAALVYGLLALRDGPVDVAAPAGGSDPTCARLADRLPATLRGQARRATTSASPAVAAWGDPAIVWRCGVTPPGPTANECTQVNGVDWVREPLTDGNSFTTYGREPAVQLLVPRAYAPEPLTLPALSAVVAAVPQGDRRCT
ncbi:MAG TPA: DUF3515 family protein [Actinomycetales bacterium]|nr:DUF3515 family protein [Actinomycetales bacterium]